MFDISMMIASSDITTVTITAASASAIVPCEIRNRDDFNKRLSYRLTTPLALVAAFTAEAYFLVHLGSDGTVFVLLAGVMTALLRKCAAPLRNANMLLREPGDDRSSDQGVVIKEKLIKEKLIKECDGEEAVKLVWLTFNE